MIRMLLFVILFFLIASLFGFYTSIRPPQIHSAITPADLGFAYEQVSFLSYDDVVLSGWFIPSEIKNAPTIVLLHGYPADKGDVLPALAFLHKKYNLFLFDFRYFGQSEGRYTTAGAKEVKDFHAGLDYLRTRGITEVGVWGFSMGGAVALMTAGERSEIKAVISEAGYARLLDMVHEIYRAPFLDYPLVQMTRLWGILFLGIDINDVSPAVSAEKLTIPVLVVHSMNDDVVPFYQALILKDALKYNPHAEFLFPEFLTHGQLDEQYQERIEQFFDASMARL